MDRDSLLVDITSPEVLISIGGEPVSVGITGAETMADIVGQEEIVVGFSDGGIEVAVED